MPDLVMSTQVFARNRFGQFTADLEAAGTRTVKAALEDGAKVARAEFLPHSRTGETLGSIRVRMVNAREGRLVAGGKAKFLEEGTPEHAITASRSNRLHFYWEKEGRWVHAPSVRHPGAAGVHFLAAGARAANATVMSHARREYP